MYSGVIAGGQGGAIAPPEMFVGGQKYNFAPPTNNPHLKSIFNKTVNILL